MIGLNSFFEKKCLYEYYDHIITKFQDGKVTPKKITVDKTKDDFTVQFLPDINLSMNYRIQFKTLLTGSREEVLKTPGMDLYMDICRFHYCCKNYKTKEKEFLDRLYRAFPGSIDKVEAGNSLEYTFVEKKTNVL